MELTEKVAQEVVVGDADQLVLTYGTLKMGWGNYRHIIEPYIKNGLAEYIGPVKTKPEYTMVSLGGFPGVIPAGNTAITGDLFRIKSQDALRRMNSLEGHYGRGSSHNFYDTTDVETEHGSALMYILDESYLDTRQIVESGIWERARY